MQGVDVTGIKTVIGYGIPATLLQLYKVFEYMFLEVGVNLLIQLIGQGGRDGSLCTVHILNLIALGKFCITRSNTPMLYCVCLNG